jgi:hypothetical protein
VPARGFAKFVVTLTIHGDRLREWTLNSGDLGANPDVLTVLEYDGYIWLDNPRTPEDDENPLHLAWQVLPRLAGNVKPSSRTVDIDGEFEGFPAGSVTLRNRGVGPAYIDAYSLIGESPNLSEGERGANAPIIDLRYLGVATFPVPAGFCSEVDSFVMAFAFNTWERQTHAVAPAQFEVDLDVDQDGTFDYAVFNFDLSLSGSISDGRNVTWVLDLATGDASAFFFTEHGTNSANTVLLFCGEQIGLNASNFGQPMDAQPLAVDWYFTGTVTDFLDVLTVAPLGERYLGLVSDIAPGDSERLTVLDFGSGVNSTETGILLLLDGARADEEGNIVRSGAPPKNEAIAIKVEN